ncbi:uroporphyrinogen-III synthase [Zooshikella harenae]|uniref:Uroporphyrinogen-III synthase n=1 Tax=Zooshikella harenae TaxID=2827238 RepID=A0ABS5Z5Z2_9GAMM|nr:uroporphyrinogen-III synthase [Zooshikella harenae]MBU2709474.1 uroporphyrinogen-III synthase [Zooshikella harenae]
MTTPVFLVTRPEPQASQLVHSMELAGLCALALPMIAIQPLPESAQLRATWQNLAQFDKVIVTSTAAAQIGLYQAEQYWPQWPVGLAWFAIGQATAAVMRQLSIDSALSDQGVDSEALLALPVLQDVQQQRVLLIKGKGGRSLIQQTLESRGADVTTCCVYERVEPLYHVQDVERLIKDQGVTTIIATSGEIASNLLEYIDGTMAANLQLIVPSERVALLQQKQQWADIFVAEGASDQAILKCIQRHIL